MEDIISCFMDKLTSHLFWFVIYSFFNFLEIIGRISSDCPWTMAKPASERTKEA